jgi:hypothetical protein
MPGKASATPQNLFDYSTTATHANQLLQEFVRGTLANAVAAYRSTAIDFGGSIPNLTVGLGGAIDTDVLRHVATVLDTDARVRLVGQAFEAADGSSSLTPPTWGDLEHPGQRVVHTTDAFIASQPATAGKALADKVIQGLAASGDQYLADFDPFQVIAANGDPAFSAAFLKELPRQDLIRIMAYYGGSDSQQTVVQVLLQWYGNGQLDKATLATISSQLFRYETDDGHTYNSYDGGSLASALLGALKGAPPQVQARFATSLVGDPATLKQFLAGINRNADGTYASYGQRRASEKEFLSVLTSATSAMDPADVQALATAVGKGLPKMSTEDLKALLPDLKAFYSAGLGRSIESPPATGDPTDWAHRVGTAWSQELGPFLQKAAAATPTANARNELIKSMIQGAYLNVGFAVIGGPEGLVGEAAMGGLQSALGEEDPVKHLVLDRMFPDDKKNLRVTSKINDPIVSVGESFAVAHLLACRPLYAAGSDKPLRLTGGAADANLVHDVLTNPENYRIEPKSSESVSVRNILDAFEDEEYHAEASALDPG